jgi:hypothetical protein
MWFLEPKCELLCMMMNAWLTSLTLHHSVPEQEMIDLWQFSNAVQKKTGLRNLKPIETNERQ